LKALTIYLGSKCNLNCKYCHREKDSIENGISDNLLNYIKKNDIKHISFIGGEPTLYMNDIQRVVEANPMADFKITTNGVGIKKYLPYFLSHKFLVCVSFDGNNELRGYDPFQEVIDYPYIAVSCTLYHGNTNFNDIIKKFAEKEKIVGKHLSFFPHIMHYTSDSNKQYRLTDDDFDSIVEQYKKYVTKYVLDYIRYGVENVRYKGLFTQLKSQYEAKYHFGETYCVNHYRQKCNSEGELFSCLYIRNQKPDDISEHIKVNFPECSSCYVYDMCGGACIKSLEHEKECRYYFKLYSWFKKFYELHKEFM